MSANQTTSQPLVPFTSYQKWVIGILAFLQFTIILDFMIMSPLGAMLMPAFQITPSQFGLVVSVYAFSAGASGILASGFADRFDRKKLLLFFYTGFLAGTLFCGLAPTYELLLAARIVTGLFGGVIGSIVLAITTDLFPMEKRGRVMGFIQTAFGASQVLGIPAGLYISQLWGWHAPFLMIVAVGALVGLVIFTKLEPVNGHLSLKTDKSPFHHLMTTVTNPNYLMAFVATALLSLGGFMIMPFGSAFTVHNMGIAMGDLPLIYLVTGICAMVTGPLIGRASDSFGKFKVFMFGTLISMVMVIFYTHMGLSPLWLVMLVNIIFFVGIFSRMIPSQALMSAIPTPANRGAFMAISSSLQQVSGGLGAVVAGLIVVEAADGSLQHFDKVGYVVAFTSLLTLMMMYIIHRSLSKKLRNQ